MGSYSSHTVTTAVETNPIIDRDLKQVQCCIPPPISHEELQASPRLDGVANGDGAIFDARSVDDKKNNNAQFTGMRWEKGVAGRCER